MHEGWKPLIPVLPRHTAFFTASDTNFAEFSMHGGRFVSLSWRDLSPTAVFR